MRLRKLFRGVRLKSGAQWAVGLSANRPLGSTVIRNSVAVNKKRFQCKQINFNESIARLTFFSNVKARVHNVNQ